MAPFVDVSPATNQDVDVVPAVPAAQGKQQDLNAAIAAAIQQNRPLIHRLARRTKMDIQDAKQEAAVLLYSRPELLFEPKKLRSALQRVLRIYASPPHDALARAKQVDDIVSTEECGCGHVLSVVRGTSIERWRVGEPSMGTINSLVGAVAKRPSGRKTALHVLELHLMRGGTLTNTEVAHILDIDPRRVQQIVKGAEKAAWSLR